MYQEMQNEWALAHPVLANMYLVKRRGKFAPVDDLVFESKEEKKEKKTRMQNFSVYSNRNLNRPVLSKLCLQCNTQIFKKPKLSYKEWDNIKLCSVACRILFKKK